MTSRVEHYLAHLDALSGGVEPRFKRIESGDPSLHAVTVIIYDAVPQPDMTTAFTYGVSLAEHEEWRHGKPELTITVRSDDDIWAVAMGHLAEDLRGEAPFAYGDTLNFGERIVASCAMTAFVVFAPAVLEPVDAHVDVGDALPIHVAGLYPIHDAERRWIHEHGFNAFWDLDFDPYDVGRPPAVPPSA